MAKGIDIPDVVSNVKVAINAQGKSSKATSTYTIKKLEQNIIGKYNTLTQDMLSESNCKYIIKYDYTLANNTIVVPENCILEFDGGSISNGTLVGNNTIISTILEEDKVLININKQGTIIVQPWDFNVKPDEEDVTNAGGLIKFKDKEAGNGMGKVILRNNFVEQYPSNIWMFTKVKGIVYLLYSYKGKVYAIYNADEYRGLVLKNNVVKETLSYNPENLPEIVGENYLTYTTEDNIHTITLPDGSTITSSVLDATEMFMLEEVEKVRVNLLTQDMIDKENTIYVIKYDFELAEDITVPNGCVLEFDGGSIGGAYTITGNNTGIHAPKVGIFGEVSFAGTWDVPYITSEWIKNITEKDGIKQLINLTNDNVNNTIVIESGEYEVTVPKSAHSIYGNAALDLKSNTTLIINGTIKLVNSPYIATTIIRIENKENVVITGEGKIVGNVESAPSVDAWPFAFGIWVIGKNIIVQNLEISECGGDAITVGREIQEGFVHSENISISNLYIHDCNRQGISVIDADNVKISNNTIDNIEGVSGAGCAIDIEMSYLWHSLKNIYITNNICTNCFKAINAYDMSNSQREDKNPIKNIIVENNKADDLIIDIRHSSVTKIDNNLCRSIICGAISGLISNNIIIAENDIEHYQNNAGVIFTGITSNLKVVNNTITSTYLAQAIDDVIFENNTITVTKLFRNYNATVYRLHFKSNTIICKNLDVPYFYCIFDGNNIKCESFEIGKFIYNEQEEITSCESYNNFLNNEIRLQNSSLIYLKAGTKTSFINNSIIFSKGCILKVYDKVYLENNTLVRTVIYVENDNVFIKNNIFTFCLDRFININANSVFVSNNVFDIGNAGSAMGLYIQKQNAKNIIIRENVCKGTNFGLVVNAASGNYSALTLLYNIKENNTTNYYYGHLLINSTIELNYPKSGTTRPTNIPNNLPIQFFDTSLNPPKPIYWNGTAWVDATGQTV